MGIFNINNISSDVKKEQLPRLGQVSKWMNDDEC
jgi:hypothetical protein